MSERTFSEEQIQALLKRAAQLQVIDAGEAPGLTMAELEQIAAEAGIPPKYLRTALHEADHGVSDTDVSGQTRTHAFVERVIPGELSDEDWEAVVFRLRKQYGNDMAAAYGMGPRYGKGVTESIGKTREWQHSSSLGVVTTLTIRPLGRKQHVSLQRRVGLSSPRVEGIAYGGLISLVFLGIAAAIFETFPLAFLVMLAAWALAAPGVESLDRRWRGKILGEMNDVVADIDAIIREDLPAEAVESTADGVQLNRDPDTRTQGPRLDPIPDPDSEMAGSASGRTGRERA